RLGPVCGMARDADGLVRNAVPGLRPPDHGNVACGAPGHRHRPALQGLDAPGGDRLPGQPHGAGAARHRERSRPLHLLAGPGAVLLHRLSHAAQPARGSRARARRQVRPEALPRHYPRPGRGAAAGAGAGSAQVHRRAEGRPVRQRVGYVRGDDGVQLAWSEIGRGKPLVRAATWMTHLQYDLESPVWAHWLRFLGGHFRAVRYDERGCGMSDWNTGDLDATHWLGDLEQVVDAARIDEPMVLLGISQGASTAIRYAVRHPERVSHLVLYGGYAVGGN